MNRSTNAASQRSINEYPEHLNPFYEDEQHKRLRFFKMPTLGKKIRRRESFSFDGFKDFWTSKSFWFRKRSSTLGINKTSESPPSMRKEYAEYNDNLNSGFIRHGVSRTSLPYFPQRNVANENVGRYNTLHRSTVHTPQNDNRSPFLSATMRASAHHRASIDQPSITPLAVRKNGGHIQQIARKSVSDMNLYEDIDNQPGNPFADSTPIRNSIRKKYRAPPPPLRTTPLRTVEKKSVDVSTEPRCIIVEKIEPAKETHADADADVDDTQIHLKNVLAAIENLNCDAQDDLPQTHATHSKRQDGDRCEQLTSTTIDNDRHECRVETVIIHNTLDSVEAAKPEQIDQLELHKPKPNNSLQITESNEDLFRSNLIYNQRLECALPTMANNNDGDYDNCHTRTPDRKQSFSDCDANGRPHSIDEIIDRINRCQSMLKVKKDADTTTINSGNEKYYYPVQNVAVASEPVRPPVRRNSRSALTTFTTFEPSGNVTKPKQATTGTDLNHNLIPKPVRDFSESIEIQMRKRESSDVQDWNPVPKPRRSRHNMDTFH